jgi:PhnB protein
MKLSTYLFFNGNCEEAIAAYQEILGGKITMMRAYDEMPPGEGQVSPGWGSKIMHACLEIEGQQLMASDAPPEYSEGAMQGVSVSVAVKEPAEAERIFAALSPNAKIEMPMAETFWSPRFGMLRDRFGTNWMVGADMPAEMADCG